MIEMPSQLTQAASAAKTATNEMAGLSSDACDLFGSMGSLLDDIGKAIMQAAERAMQAVTETIGKISKAINDAVGAVGDLVKRAFAKIDELGGLVISAINDVLGAISEAIGKAMAAIDRAVTAVKGAISDVIAKLGSMVRSIGISGCPGTKALATSLGDQAGGALADAKQLAENGSLTGTAAGTAANASAESAKNVATGAKDELSAASTEMDSTIKSSVSSLDRLVG
jgi:phage-related protein